jgi:hypothetical protein
MNFDTKKFIVIVLLMSAFCFAYYLLWRSISLPLLVTAHSNGKLVIVKSIPKYRNAFAYETGMTIDADGAPDAYAPGNKGADDLANGGSPGNWWALATDNNKPDGVPVVRNGYYVSMTSLADDKFASDDPSRYVNANIIPFFVLPKLVQNAGGVKLGDLGLVVNLQNGKSSPAIFADEGPPDHLGEGSVALAKLLDIDPNPRIGGTDREVLYIVFPGSGDGKPHDSSFIQEKVNEIVKKLGGIKHLIHNWKRSKYVPPS